jgi:hypothetical protein
MVTGIVVACIAGVLVDAVFGRKHRRGPGRVESA